MSKEIPNNLYIKTAWLYDFDQRDIVTMDILFYKEYAKKQGGLILELCCGTGRVSLELAKMGYKVTGLDLSDKMLEQFKQKLQNENDDINNRIELREGNIADFSFDNKFELIIIPYRSFQSLTDESEIKSCLRSIKKSLSETGIFIINVFNPKEGMKIGKWCYPKTVQWERVDEKTGNTITKSHWGDRIDIENQIIYPHMTYTVENIDGKKKDYHEDLSLKYYFYEQLKSLLEDNGFIVIEEYGWYDKSDIKIGKELILVCKKR